MIHALKGVNSTVSFLLELAVLTAVGYRAYTLGRTRSASLLLGIGAVVTWIVVWALFGSPGATFEQHGVGRAVLETLWFGSAALALVWTSRQRLALVFVVVYAVN